MKETAEEIILTDERKPVLYDAAGKALISRVGFRVVEDQKPEE